MQIEIGLSESKVALAVLVVVVLASLIAIGLLGRVVTPRRSGEATWLTPERWQAAALEQRAQAETEILHQDYSDLRQLLEASALDPVDAMLLAQRIYADNRSGTSATAIARQSLIAAAATTAQFASGSAAQSDAVTALNLALSRIEMLSPSPTPVVTATPPLRSLTP